ncbi:hypothetical protein HYX70_02705 [Candidatus Saccharibacteria bacterium]|nr:hypothetical protein [Candidatus Saccharibacteria bacterium]
MNIIDEVKKLNLPIGSYAVFGSGPMQVRKIKPFNKDIDLIVTPQLYEQMKSAGWDEKFWDEGTRYLVKGILEVCDTWDYPPYHPDVAKLIKQAEVIEGVPFVQLEEVLKYKKAYNRPKDQVDAKLIEDYLSSQLPQPHSPAA